jgi:folylpolyglutamate synthase/dihydrofolate synthase
VQFGVVEVGMGGTLDATNILNNQAVSVISKIARDHQSFLGDTLDQIARHKAGILRPNVPYIVNPRNEHNVLDVIKQYAEDIGAGPRLLFDPPELKETLFSKKNWLRSSDRLRQSEKDNAILAVVASKTAVESMDLEFRPFDIGSILWRSRMLVNPGRFESIRVPPIFGGPYRNGYDNRGPPILVDGAHNPDAAKVLHDYVENSQRRKKISVDKRVPRYGWPVTWVFAMTEGKDAHQYLSVLLRPGDNVITTTFGPVDGMPWVKPMDPKELLKIAKSIEPSVTGLAIPEDGALRALCAARYLTERDHPIVLTGSLYLVGDFHREFRPRQSKDYWKEPQFEEDRNMIGNVLKEEKHRVNQLLSGYQPDSFSQSSDKNNGRDEKSRSIYLKLQESKRESRRVIQEEVQALDREMERLAEEERRLAQGQPSNPSNDTNPPSDHSLKTNAPANGASLPVSTKSTEEVTLRTEARPVAESPPKFSDSNICSNSQTPSSQESPKASATFENPQLPGSTAIDPLANPQPATPSSQPTASPTDDPPAPQVRPVYCWDSKLDPDMKVKPLEKLIWHDKKQPLGFYKKREKKEIKKMVKKLKKG